MKLVFHPLTSTHWKDFEKLFGKQGACAGCWCMWWRLVQRDWKAGRGAKNKRAMKRLVDSGAVPGILAYAGGEAVGWCSVAPRESLLRLEQARTLKRIDDKPVWAACCFFCPLC